MSSTCYIFSPFFFFFGSFKLLQILRLLKKPKLYYSYSNATRPTQWKTLVKFVEHKLEETFSDVIWDVHLGRINFLSDQFLNNFPDLPPFTSLVFSIGRWNLIPSFLDNIQGVLNNFSLLKAGSYSLASNKLQCTLHAIFTRVICTLFFVASIDCPGYPTLTGKNTYYTTFSSRFGYYLEMEAACCHRSNPICLYNN